MNLKEATQLYKERWDAVAMIDREELRKTSIEKKWQQLNSIIRLAAGLGLLKPDPSEEEMYERWARLKEKASGCLPSKTG